MNIVKRIVGWIIQFLIELKIVVGICKNNQGLATLVTMWMKHSVAFVQDKPIPDPATCVKFRLLKKFVAMGVSITFYLLLWFAYTHNRPEKATVLTSLAFITMSAVACYYMWPKAKGGIWNNAETAQALDFIQAIDLRVHAFTFYNGTDPAFIDLVNHEEVKSFLDQWAEDIDDLEIYPWRAKEKDREFNLWKRAHHLLRRLYGNVLPEDYSRYFPQKSSS